MQIPPSRPSWILFLRRVGLLSVLIHTPAMALSNISLSSIKPKPEGGKCQILHWSDILQAELQSKNSCFGYIMALKHVKEGEGNSQNNNNNDWLFEALSSIKFWNKGVVPHNKLTRVVNKNASILPSPDFVSSNLRVASSSLLKK